MKFLNIGTPEIIFLAFLALIILGPERIAKNARAFGAWIRKLSQSRLWQEAVITSNELKDLPRKIMQDSNLSDSLSSIDQEIKKPISYPESTDQVGEDQP